VVHLDMSATNKTSRVELEQSIKEQLYRIALEKNITITGESPVSLFSSLILELYLKSSHVRVVILIDEYDAPIIDNIEDEYLAKEMRKSLQEFYAVLKSSEKNIRFIFITGVSKFTQASIFSKLNQLDDITLNPYYANICGFTSDELNLYFNAYLNDFLYDLKSDESMPVDATTDDLINEILAWYNGYSWDGKTKLLNPFSLIKVLDTKDFSNFWFETGTPSFIINLVKNNSLYFNLFQNNQYIAANTNSLDIGNFSTESLCAFRPPL
jgi:hypothetical protein